MAAEAEAAREAKAKVIAAEGEQKAARALKDASGTISFVDWCRWRTCSMLKLCIVDGENYAEIRFIIVGPGANTMNALPKNIYLLHKSKYFPM